MGFRALLRFRNPIPATPDFPREGKKPPIEALIYSDSRIRQAPRPWVPTVR